jgi:hypothetical protein
MRYTLKGRVLDAFRIAIPFWSKTNHSYLLKSFKNSKIKNFSDKEKAIRRFGVEPPLNEESMRSARLDLADTFFLLLTNEAELKEKRPRRYAFAKAVWDEITCDYDESSLKIAEEKK